MDTKKIEEIVRAGIAGFLSLPDKIKLILVLALAKKFFFLFVGMIVVVFLFVTYMAKQKGQRRLSTVQVQALQSEKDEDEFAHNQWYMTDYVKRKRTKKKGKGTFIVFPEKVHVLGASQERDKAMSDLTFKQHQEAVLHGDDVRGIVEVGKSSGSEYQDTSVLEPYHLGEYLEEIPGNVCWLVYQKTGKFYLSIGSIYDKKVASRMLRRRRGTLYQKLCKREMSYKKAAAKYALDEAELTGRYFNCGLLGFLRCWEIKAALKKYSYKRCVPRSKVILGFHNKKVDSYRIETVQQLTQLSLDTKKKLLKGLITPGMTILMSEAALGKPTDIEKKFDTKTGAIEIRLYGSRSSRRKKSHYLELIFKGGRLVSWSES